MPRIEIIDGPSKLDLMLALFDFWLPNNQTRSVNFKGRMNVGEQDGSLTDVYEVVIEGCRRIPGQEAWVITGEVNIPREERWSKFTGTYSTFNRIGDLEFEN